MELELKFQEKKKGSENQNSLNSFHASIHGVRGWLRRKSGVRCSELGVGEGQQVIGGG